MRVDTGDGTHRFSVCYATYGYMGDLLRTSETLRWSKCAPHMSQMTRLII